MAKLLVSVRNAEEAAEALAGGADVIDVKEPSRGSLGAATAKQLTEVRARVAGAVPLSAALGELLDGIATDQIEALEGFSFAKVGLSRCAEVPDWSQRWSRFLTQLPKAVTSVAVVYADYVAAGAPPPLQVIEFAQRMAVSVLLVDTFQKSRGCILDHLPRTVLHELIAAARSYSMRVALAGSIHPRMLAQAAEFAPDVIAVRGAVCRDSRLGAVDSSLVSHFAQRLASLSPLPQSDRAHSGPMIAASARPLWEGG